MAATTENTDPMQPKVDAARRLARIVAGDDDARFVRTVHAVLDAADAPELQGAPDDRPQREDPALVRRAAAAPRGGIPEDSIYRDQRFLDNAKELLRNRRRIVGGVRSSDFPDCVAIGSVTDWCCSGTLVAPTLIVTAGHCVAGDCGARVFVGEDVGRPRPGREVAVAEAIAHPEYRPRGVHFDIAVLVLASPITEVAPRPIAPASAIHGARSVRLVGYGTTDTTGTMGYGIRRLVDVPMASSDPRFGADPATEFVAGAPFLDRDSCRGDSGGPAYLQLRSGWALAGATSRATDSAVRLCGDGGIYTLVDAYADWLRPYIVAAGGTGNGGTRAKRRRSRRSR